MLFDLTPKRCKRNFYNFEHELEQLHKFYLSSRVVDVLGPRRIGKTSLILTFLSEWSVPTYSLIAERSFFPVMALALGVCRGAFKGFERVHL